jgi:hypothetical protein
MDIRTTQPAVGMKGTTSGFPATIVAVCEWSRSDPGVLVEVRVPGGVSCIDFSDFAPRTVSCGCCNAGCVCANHRDEPRGLPVTVCAYHREHGHPRVTSPLEGR